jgi:hypothetical protein
MNGMCKHVNVLSLPTALMSLINAVGEDYETSNGNDDDDSSGGGDDDDNYGNNNKT